MTVTAELPLREELVERGTARWLEHGTGSPDQFQKLEYRERLAADLGTTLTRIEGGKHFTPEDHPDVVAAAINELLPTARPLPTEERA